MAVLRFPRTVAAAQKRDKCMWEIGDALLDECGIPSTSGKQDGSRKKLELCAAELERELGASEYTTATLARLRDVSYAFPKGKGGRRPSLSWTAHRDAGSPEELDEIVEASSGHPVTRDLVRAIKPLVKKAKAKAKREQRIAEGTAGPEADTLEPVAEPDTSYLADIAQATAEANAARAKIARAVKLVGPWLDELEPDMTDALIEAVISVATEARELADTLRKRTGNKRGHIALVS